MWLWVVPAGSLIGLALGIASAADPSSPSRRWSTWSARRRCGDHRISRRRRDQRPDGDGRARPRGSSPVRASGRSVPSAPPDRAPGPASPRHVPAPVLLSTFAGLLRRRRALRPGGSGRLRPGRARGSTHIRRNRRGTALVGEGSAEVVPAATGVGLLTGFFGVGGGFAIVPALVLVLRFPMPDGDRDLFWSSPSTPRRRWLPGCTPGHPRPAGPPRVHHRGRDRQPPGRPPGPPPRSAPLSRAFTVLLVVVGLYIAAMNAAPARVRTAVRRRGRSIRGPVDEIAGLVRDLVRHLRSRSSAERRRRRRRVSGCPARWEDQPAVET